jgi:FkbM family methyltransferase
MKIFRLLQRFMNRIFRPDIVSIGGVRVKIPDVASERIRRAIYDGYYEAPELRLVKRYLEPVDIVMEIGAGIGLLSAYSAKIVGDDRVFAFEANPALESAIRANYRLNNVSPSLQMVLVGNRTGTHEFFVGNNFWASSIYDKAEGAKKLDVPVVDFNETLRTIDPSFLYIDVEGGEYDLIKHADFSNVRKLLIEIHDWVLSPEQILEVQATLQAHGFVLREQGGRDDYYYERRTPSDGSSDPAKPHDE